MRRTHRLALPRRAQSYLDGRAQATAGQPNVERAWKTARQTKALATVVETLQAMTGPRQRCMYCVDSHGSDIEHFWPKGPYPGRAFLWPNMLLCCTECGRFKGDRFPLSSAGDPMLVNPSAENPWEHLDFDPDTGNLTARYDAASGAPSPKGYATVQLLRLDRREGMAEGYRRAYRRIEAFVNAALSEAVIDPDQLAQQLLLADEHGLLHWCFGPVGANLRPFAALRNKAPAAWAACAAAVQ
ncbi:hypothetical protein [Ottowia sp.]|jgi:uncharacterized protein (TIGR02646 family)|uniref:hypothetical protein n=1 Tax=Ottowia sp. TaxID=1898956 RepID=UPI0025E7E068|nr:hypothetical protein [Ottowia sp.]MBK6614001.1 hypothetical protein [Ottowia sp.]MBK6745440.1 hypothetical protein [Ottowia sp.]